MSLDTIMKSLEDYNHKKREKESGLPKLSFVANEGARKLIEARLKDDQLTYGNFALCQGRAKLY